LLLPMCLSVLAVRLWRMRTSLRRWLRRLAWRRRRWNACGEWERRGWGIADDDQYAEPEKKDNKFCARHDAEAPESSLTLCWLAAAVSPDAHLVWISFRVVAVSAKRPNAGRGEGGGERQRGEEETETFGGI
jgi:hypothetical protein